jgi:tetratricopeptide (TPR) repeat protein
MIAFGRAMVSVNPMKFGARLVRGALLFAGCLFLAGCGPGSQSQLDEEREPHFLAGKSRANGLDYEGAIESFEKALTANPHSAAAHFELGCIFEQREADPAAAIYHYEKYLRLKPAAENAEIVKQHIMTCKQELARTVSLGPISEKQQHELERLIEESKRLTDENKRLSQELAQWKAAPGGRPNSPTNAAPAPAPLRAIEGSPAALADDSPAAGRTRSAGDSNRAIAGTIPAGRTHTVKPGETPIMIARHYGIRLEALLAANPKLEPRRLRVGQTMLIPAADRGVATTALAAKTF